ncbi:MAG: hypothetical protein M3069_13325, partial [Chloroflexota bacterium]|nr:hypothetical protein [Chloroflexota bacterium]
MQTTTEDPNEPHVVNYVPDEICVVVSATGIDDEASFYEHVRTRLNRQIAGLLRANSQAGDDDDDDVKEPFEADLAPTLLAQRFANHRAVLQPLRRTGGRGSKSERPEHNGGTSAGLAVREPDFTPWSVFRRQASTTHHLYFRLGRDPRQTFARLDLEQQRTGLQSVRELTLLLNRFALSAQQEPFGNRTWSIKAVSPNWLTVAFQAGCGCPAGLPVPVTSKTHRWRFRFRGALGKALEAPVRGEVVVAVLDTCPQQTSVDNAAPQFPGNALLTSVHRDVQMNTPPVNLAGQHLTGYLPRLQWDMRSGPVHDHPDHFTLADHGLFVTGIVYDVLQGGGQVRLMRVLNDQGIGDVFAITR